MGKVMGWLGTYFAAQAGQCRGTFGLRLVFSGNFRQRPVPQNSAAINGAIIFMVDCNWKLFLATAGFGTIYGLKGFARF
jgi:hypothetical protein